jgi:hypothetical protein
VIVRLGKVLVVFTIIATLSAHWALLQTVAWTTMLADNLQTKSLHEAVTQTFDGNHPCNLCKAIATAKKSEQKKQTSFEKLKLEFPPVHESLVLVAPSRPDLFPQQNSLAESRSLKPPTPPPRSFFV